MCIKVVASQTLDIFETQCIDSNCIGLHLFRDFLPPTCVGICPSGCWHFNVNKWCVYLCQQYSFLCLGIAVSDPYLPRDAMPIVTYDLCCHKMSV